MTLEARVTALERQIAELSRARNANTALGRSTMAPVDTAAVQTIQARLDPLSVREGIPVLYNFGFTGSPPIGSDLHVSFINGDRTQAVIVASNHQTYRLGNLGLGDSAVYDVRGAYLWFKAAGPSLNCGGSPMVITGDLHVTGAVIAGYGGADQVGLQTHTSTASTVRPTAGT